jgi:hypothetical protein
LHYGQIFGAESVTDGHSLSYGARAAELVVVADEISTNLRSNEDAARDIEPQTTTNVTQQVLAAYVIGATSEGTVHVRRVETDALSAETG